MSSIISPELLSRLSRWTMWAALIEFLLLRVLIRFGPMLPPSPAVTQGAQVVLLAGTVALNVAVLLATLALIVMAGLTRSLALRVLLIAAAILGLIRIILPQGATLVLDVVFVFYSVAAMAAMMVGATVPSRAWPAVARPASAGQPQAGQPQGLPLRFLHRMMLTLLIVIYAALSYPALLATIARLGWTWAASDATVIPHFIAEGLAVLVALMVYFVYRPARSKTALVVALIATVLLGGFWFARPHLASALTQWTVDFATFLPPWLYLVGLFGFLYTAIALARSSVARLRLAAYGLILVALGGLRRDYSYLSGLGLLGFFLLTKPWQE